MIFLKTHDDSTPGILVTGGRPGPELLSVLNEHYATPERVVALLSMGNASYIGPSLGDAPHDFERGAEYWRAGVSTFFRRDRRALTSQPTPDELRGVPTYVFNPESGWATPSEARPQAETITAVRGLTESLQAVAMERCRQTNTVGSNNYLSYLNLVEPSPAVPLTAEEASGPPAHTSRAYRPSAAFAPIETSEYPSLPAGGVSLRHDTATSWSLVSASGGGNSAPMGGGGNAASTAGTSRTRL